MCPPPRLFPCPNKYLWVHEHEKDQEGRPTMSTKMGQSQAGGGASTVPNLPCCGSVWTSTRDKSTRGSQPPGGHPHFCKYYFKRHCQVVRVKTGTKPSKHSAFLHKACCVLDPNQAPFCSLTEGRKLSSSSPMGLLISRSEGEKTEEHLRRSSHDTMEHFLSEKSNQKSCK